MRRQNSTRFMLLLLLLLLAGCGGGRDDSPAGGISVDRSIKGPIMVFAASSLTDAFTSIGGQFHRRCPNCDVCFNFAGTQTLLTQLQNGAQADVFVSANVVKMREALDRALVTHPQAFATNRLCVALAPGEKNLTLRDLAKPGLRLGVAIPECPVGQYTQKVFSKLAASKEYGPAFVKKLRANIAVEEMSVRRIVARVQLGEIDAGFVYDSDQKAAKDRGVGRLEIPDPYNVVATYPIALCARVQNRKGAEAFIDFVLSATGQTILAAYGFGPASSASACEFRELESLSNTKR